MQSLIKDIVNSSIQIKAQAFEENESQILQAGEIISSSLKSGGKILIFGNGGSAADSQHFAAELVGRFQKERKGLPAVALTTDTSIITAVGNDYGFEKIFERQIEALGLEGDVAVGISTSGSSQNVIQAIRKAKESGLKTISLTGKDGGMLKTLTDVSLVVRSNVTARVQETHICMIHVICEIVEAGI